MQSHSLVQIGTGDKESTMEAGLGKQSLSPHRSECLWKMTEEGKRRLKLARPGFGKKPGDFAERGYEGFGGVAATSLRNGELWKYIFKTFTERYE